jgi:hypothetical protein
MYVSDIRCYIIQGRRLLPMNRPNVRNALRKCHVTSFLCHWRNITWSCCSGNALTSRFLVPVVPLQYCHAIFLLFRHGGNVTWSCSYCGIAEMSRDIAAVRAMRKWHVILLRRCGNHVVLFLLCHCSNVTRSCCCSGTAEMSCELALVVALQKCHVILLLFGHCGNGTWSCSWSFIAELTSDVALGVAE